MNMLSMKIKGRTYELFFLFSITFLVLALFVSKQALTKNVKLAYIKCPPEVEIGETFQVQVGVQNLASSTDIIIGAHMNSPPAYMLGEYRRERIFLEGGKVWDHTFEFKPMFKGVSNIQVTIELLSPGGAHYASETITIDVKRTS